MREWFLLGVLLFLSAPACASARAQSDSSAVPAYSSLPASQQHALLLGEPRSSTQIEDSPFGIMTTICAEGGPAEYVERAASVIGAAGYKWVSEYLQLSWKPNEAPQLSDAARWSRLPARCTEHLGRLQAQHVDVLMRMDPLPTRMLRGGEEASAEDLARATAYTRAAVQQLKGYVKHWQIGNEPNVANAPEGYVKVAAAIASAIRAEQPDAVIYGPAVAMLQCMANEPFPWLPKALDAGLLRHIDVFSFHPYRANGDEPERASEFARFRHWPSYSNQLAMLRKLLRAKAGGHAPKLAVSEDGESSAISADGEQRITPIVDAKNELRRALLDTAEGIYPRIHFVLFRNIPDADYSREGSFNVVNSQLDKKPLYYAAQNLHAVLDSSYSPTDRVRVNVYSTSNNQVQTYLKHQAGFDELLVFFWSPTPAQNMHVRVPARLTVSGSDWKAPVLIDLMTMPGHAKNIGNGPSTHQRTTFPTAHKTPAGVQVEGLELRDYPQLLKLIRPSTAPQPTAENR